MNIDLEDLNTNELEALLRHARGFVPESGDGREDGRLERALESLRDALEGAMAKG